MTKIGANFDWQFQLPMKVGVLTTANKIGVSTTANFVGSCHWQLAVEHWQLSIGSYHLATAIENVAIVKTNN